MTNVILNSINYILLLKNAPPKLTLKLQVIVPILDRSMDNFVTFSKFDRFFRLHSLIHTNEPIFFFPITQHFGCISYEIAQKNHSTSIVMERFL